MLKRLRFALISLDDKFTLSSYFQQVTKGNFMLPQCKRPTAQTTILEKPYLQKVFKHLNDFQLNTK